jgi:hypothetical protein
MIMTPCYYLENCKIEKLSNMCCKGQEGCDLVNLDEETILIMEVSNSARSQKTKGNRKIWNNM